MDQKENDKRPTIEELAQRLRETREDYDRCHEIYESAGRDETTALNKLNDAMKAFDAGVEAMREKAPWNSDWYNRMKTNAST